MSDVEKKDTNSVAVPAPTVWPMVLALGLGLILTGMVTSIAVSILGLALALRAGFGWFMDVFPMQREELHAIPAGSAPTGESTATKTKAPADAMHRKILPVERFKLITGVKGGIAGGVAMIVPATLFSVLRHHSLWYAMNLLAAGGFVSWAGASNAFLSEFHMEGLIAALVIHAVTSLLVGSLYGAMLPMFPRFPILTAGVIAPFLWTGLLYSVLGVVSPILDKRIEWFWFVPSQMAFGFVAGFVVNLQEKVRTKQFRELPFAVRAGIASDRGSREPE